MTAPKEQLQALIAEIDSVLQQTTPRLPWVMSGNASQQRKVLERVRNHLVALQRQMGPEAGDRPGGSPADPSLYDIYYRPSWSQSRTQESPGSASDRAAQQMLHLMTQEVVHLRTTLVQPLQTELASLHQQREALQAEVRQLEMQQQSYLLQSQAHSQQLLNESLQSWMERLQANLAQVMDQRSSGGGQLFAEAESLPLRDSGEFIPPPVSELSRDRDPATVVEATVEAVAEPPANATIDAPVNAPVNSTVEAVAEPPANATIDAAIQAVSEAISEATASPSLEMPLAKKPGGASITPWIVDLDPSLKDVGEMVLQPDKLQFPYPGVEVVSPWPQPPTPPPVPMDAAIDHWIRSAGADREVSAASLEFTDLNLAELRLSQLEAQEIDGLLGPDSGPVPPATVVTAEAPPAAPPPGTAPDAAIALSFEEALDASWGQLEPPVEPAAAAEPSTDGALRAAETGVWVPPGIDEFDDFYQNLFGAAATASEAEAVSSDRLPGHGPDGTLGEPAMVSDRAAADPRDQINSLEDLFEALPPLATRAVPEEPRSPTVGFDFQESEAAFIPASPEEILLPSDSGDSGSEIELELDAITFTSLSEDLSNLEQSADALRSAALDWDQALEPEKRRFSDQPRVQPTPATPPVATPPAAEALVLEESPDFSWEALAEPRAAAGLFADAPALPVGTPAPATPLTVADGTDSWPDAPGAASVLAPESAATAFTLERWDDLFVEMPALDAAAAATQDPAAAGTQSPAPETSPVDFTLDPVGNVFVEVLWDAAVPPPGDRLPEGDRPDPA